MKRAIIIMTKVPSAGNVKTRLQPFLSADECAALAGAFLKDAVNKAKTVCENVILAYSSHAEINALKKILPFQNNFIEQTGRDLGEKMFNAFKFVLEDRTDAVVMIGTDSPTFPSDFIEQAFEFLETNSDVVLGKTEDGGFYLIGLRKLESEIFENVAWSSPETFEQVFLNIHRLNLHLREVPSWYDVDEKKDFEKLSEEILFNKNAQRRAPKTYALITEWEKF
ncbi:TIGR04282 family arsenosugar biosynthesis glycosyltransferase [soil metagenome]